MADGVGEVLAGIATVGDMTAAFQDEDRCRGGLLVAADRPDDGPAVELGEHQVEDDERRPVPLDRVERRRPVRGGHDAAPVPLQVRPDEAHDLRVVVDDQDRPVGRGRGLHLDDHHRRPYDRAVTAS